MAWAGTALLALLFGANWFQPQSLAEPAAHEINRPVARWRGRWAELANARLAALDIDARIDHRSLEAQGIALEPQSQIDAPAKRIQNRIIESEGTEANRAEMHREIARGNGARIIADPSLALDAITHQRSTFTSRDMAKFAHRHSDVIDQFNEVMGAMRSAPDLVELGRDARGEDRLTIRAMIEAEQRLHRAAELMAECERHQVRGADREAAFASAEQRGLVPSGEQADALAHITQPAGCSDFQLHRSLAPIFPANDTWSIQRTVLNALQRSYAANCNPVRRNC